MADLSHKITSNFEQAVLEYLVTLESRIAALEDCILNRPNPPTDGQSPLVDANLAAGFVCPECTAKQSEPSVNGKVNFREWM